MKIGRLGIFITYIFAGSILWAEPKISARVSATEMSLNSSINLALEISGINNLDSSPNLSLPDFQIQRAGQTQSFQWINGQTSSFITFNYVLTPVKTGSLTIPPITLNQGDQKYSTDPITVTVHPDSDQKTTQNSPPQGSASNVTVPDEGLKPVFMTAKVDKSKAYVGEQILLIVQFLRQPNAPIASQPRYSEPDMTGFIVEPLKQQEYNTSINGVPFIVTELRYSLFPTSDGDFAIGSANIDVAIRTRGDPFDPNNFFPKLIWPSSSGEIKNQSDSDPRSCLAGK